MYNGQYQTTKVIYKKNVINSLFTSTSYQVIKTCISKKKTKNKQLVKKLLSRFEFRKRSLHNHRNAIQLKKKLIFDKTCHNKVFTPLSFLEFGS